MQLEAKAREYCALIDAAESQDATAFVVDLARALADVIAEAMRLPDKPPAGRGIPPGPTNEEWGDRFGAVNTALADSQGYWTTLAPFGSEAEEVVELPLADDLVDVWRDLKSGLMAIEAGSPEEDVLWEWRFGFYTHWGRHAAEALRVLQARLAESGGPLRT